MKNQSERTGNMLARRDFIKTMGALPLAAVLADPKLAQAAADGLQTVQLTLDSGKKVSASLAVPEKTPAPCVMLIHEWWGLNNQIKAVAADLAAQGYVTLAIDLMDGAVTTSPRQARVQYNAVNADVATETCVSWINWLRSHEASTGKVGVCGWCFGGGWSLQASISAPVDATVIYYGRVDKPSYRLVRLKGPVLGHFATNDRFISESMVVGFVEEMKSVGKEATVYWYKASHGFANPTSAIYDEENAATSWERTKSFLASRLELKS